jgi:flagellar motor switch protein FliN/FliY
MSTTQPPGGQITGQMAGQMAGQVSGQMAGQMSGQLSGQGTGHGTGHGTGPVAGKMPGQNPGSASLPAAAAAGSNPTLVTAPAPPEEEEESGLRAPVTRLPVELDVMIPVREFRVRDLLALQPGRLIESQWASGEDLPINSGDVLLAWSEFEVVETQLAVRVTRLA